MLDRFVYVVLSCELQCLLAAIGSSPCFGALVVMHCPHNRQEGFAQHGVCVFCPTILACASLQWRRPHPNVITRFVGKGCPFCEASCCSVYR